MAKRKRYKVSLESETLAISLVENPAMDSNFVALSKEEERELVKLSSDEKHIVYGAVLIPEKDIYRANNGGYYINFSKESIEKMSQDIMKEYRQFDIKADHKDEVSDAYIVESWIVSDQYKDKANALGITAPEGTWMAGVKVNNQETWDRIKNGELNGFSVESILAYSEIEEFEKQNDNNMNLETNDEMFWSKLKSTIAELFSKQTEKSEPVEEINLETEPSPEPQEPIAEPTPEPQEPKQEPVVEPTVQEPKNEPTEPKNEPQEPQPIEEPKDNHLEELINSLKDEINALKEMNNGLNDKVKELSRQPSTQPINTNAKPNASDTYASWREQMRSYM